MCVATKTKPLNKVDSKPHSESKQCSRKTPCQNCKAISVKIDKPAKTKKKPMTKVGCWRGVFKGTLDY